MRGLSEVEHSMKTVTLSANTSWYLYNFRASTIRRFIDDDYRVICLSPEDNYSRKLETDLGAEWQKIGMDNKGANPLRDIGLFLQFWRLYRELRPVAALHFTIKNNVYGTWAARLSGVPAINNVSGLGTAFIRSGLVPAIVRLLYRLSQPIAYRIFCQNEEDLALLVERKLVPADRLALLPGSGVDLYRFRPDLRRSHDGPFRFLYAGRMLHDKGVSELVSAVNLVNTDALRCELWLSGFADADNVSSIARDQLRRWGELPGVEWLGPSDAMEEVYSVVDCVVLPSYREGMPRSLLEAGAMGLPVIATDVPGCRNVVQDGVNGLLCEARNSHSLYRAMRRILTLSPAERLEMGENGRAIVAGKYDERLVVEATVEAVTSAARCG